MQIQKILNKILKNRLLTGALILIIIAGGYFGYKAIFKSKDSIRYAFVQVEKGTLISSISGSGQVSALNQIDIKPKNSGNVIYIGVNNGQKVKSGTLIARIDAADAQKAVRDAEINLETAKISLEQAKNTENSAENGLKRAYEQGFNDVSSAFLDFPGVMSGLSDILFDNTIAPNTTFSDTTSNLNIYLYYTEPLEKRSDFNSIYYKSYHTAKSLYENNLVNYKSASRFSDQNTIESLVEETYQTVKAISEALKNADNLLQLYKRILIKKDNLAINQILDDYSSNLNAYTSKINQRLLNLFSVEQTFKEKGSVDPLNIRSKEISVKQRENALLDARKTLSDYSVYAPFDGMIAKLNITKGDLISSASNVSTASAIATLITEQKIAEISLNEVDAAKIKTGQKTTLTFDAIPDLSITGEVTEIDSIGTVSQGVVTYNVKIAFDTQDVRIKPAMSVSAAVITQAKPDVLLIPNSALKQQNGTNYVEMANEPDINSQTLASAKNGIMLKNSPLEKTVEVGASNDEYTEIISGLKEGDFVISRTIQANSKQNQSQQQSSPSLFRVPTGGGTRSNGLRQ